MLSFNEYVGGYTVISEDLHPDLHAAIHADMPAQNKLHHVVKAIKGIAGKGSSTGLSDNTPKKGSSRAVFLPRDPHPVKVDGKDTHMHTAVKVAFPGTLDKYNKSGALLGEHQNLVEADHYTNNAYGVLRKNHHGHFESNPHGVLPPLLDAHDQGHHLHVAQVSSLKAGEFRDLTKTADHPKGISHTEFHDALMEHYHAAHGNKHYGTTDRTRMEHVQSHPLVEKFQDFVANTGNHPGDFRMANMGKWKHPVTGQHHIVASDFGFSTEVAKHYHNARQNMYKENMEKNRGW